MLFIGTDPLSVFIREAAIRPFSFGDWDCLQWLARWIEIRRGIDPGASWRSEYADMRGALRLVREAGGMAGHVDRCLRPFGIRRTDSPKRGDIAIVRQTKPGHDPFDGCLGAIVLGEGKTFVVLQPEGIGVCNDETMPLVAAWSV